MSQIHRVHQRSSLVKQADLKTLREARTYGPQLWQNGMDLLASIQTENKVELESLWSAPDADEWADKIKTQTAPRLTADEVSELENDLDAGNRISKFRQTAGERAEARAEIAELAEKPWTNLD